MSMLLEIQEKLQDTNAAIAQLERAVATDPNSRSLQITARSLEKRWQTLEQEFYAAAQAIGADVCRYRLFSDECSASLRALTDALSGFQTLFSVVYDAIKHGPKQRVRISADVAQITSFGFAYSFSGSTGVVLTLPNERLLFGETEFDQAMDTISAMAKAATPDEVLTFANKVGVASVRSMYRWAHDHVQAKFGADVEWRRGQVVRTKLLVQKPELERLERTIAATSTATEEMVTLTGNLVGADVPRKSFHMQFAGAADIRGSFSDAIGPEHTVELPKRYTAILLKKTQILYSTEEEQVSYFLERLQPAD